MPTKTKIAQVLQDEIRHFFFSLSGDEPLLIKVIEESLMGFERVAFELHLSSGHPTKSIYTCPSTICRENDKSLNRIYSNIIALRRSQAADGLL